MPYTTTYRSAALLGLLGFLLGIGLGAAQPTAEAYLLRRAARVAVVRRMGPNPSRTAFLRRSERLALRMSSSARDAQVLHAAATVREENGFPAFGRTVYPVDRVPNWGDMHSPDEWNRTYAELPDAAFVPVPAYDLQTLTRPMSGLLQPFLQDNVPVITAKLFYSTRFMGTYDIDAGEYAGNHAGVDLKLAYGTPIGVIAGGLVTAVGVDPVLGTRVIVEHRHPDDGTFFSVYGHLSAASVREGEELAPGDVIGTVGLTGVTSGPHLHLQVDRGLPGEAHVRYVPLGVRPGPDAVRDATVNPMEFIQRYADGA